MPGLKRYGLLLTACILAGGAAAQSSNDTLTLVNGEILRGELVDIEDGIVTFHTRHGSRTYLPADQIEAAETDAPRTVEAKDQRSATGRLSIEEGDVRIDARSGPVLFAIADIAHVARVEAAAETADTSSGWEFGVGSGVLYRDSNRSNVDLYAHIDLNRSDGWNRWKWSSLFALDDADDFPAYGRSEVSWRNSPDWGSHFALAGVERDQDAAIDARAYAAGGVDAYAFNRPKHRLLGGIGLGVVYESFDADGPFEGRSEDELRWRIRAREFGDLPSASDTDLELLLRMIYEAQLHDRLALRDELRVMPSLTDAGDVRASYNSTVAWRLLDNLELNLQLRIDYDDDPPFAEIDRWRAAVGAGVRIRFGTR
jgi:hypothetical protein